jgi:hypothetical protein
VRDGVAASGLDPADAESIAADSRLVRTVRWRLVLWSGLSTLVVLLVLGFAMYWVAATTLQANGIQQLTDRTNQVTEAIQNPLGRPGGPEYGFIFGGNSSGTFAWPRSTQMATASTPWARRRAARPDRPSRPRWVPSASPDSDDRRPCRKPGG